MEELDCMKLYEDPDQYDIEYDDLKDDIDYYLKRIPAGQHVLELGCGTGRVSIELAREGRKVTGLDISRPMLEVASQKAHEAGVGIELLEADCRNFLLNKGFPWVIFPFNSFCHLHDLSSIEGCLRSVVNHLEPDGRFILDLVNPTYELLTCSPDDNPAVAEFPDTLGRGQIVIREFAVYDELAQIKRITWTYWLGDGLVKTTHLNMRLFYPQEIDGLLHYNGLEVIERSGNYDGCPFADGSPRHLLVCRVAKNQKNQRSSFI